MPQGLKGDSYGEQWNVLPLGTWRPWGQGETVFRDLLPLNLTLYLWSEKVAPVTRKDL